jgi:hypothetical protein
MEKRRKLLSLYPSEFLARTPITKDRSREK